MKELRPDSIFEDLNSWYGDEGTVKLGEKYSSMERKVKKGETDEDAS